MPEGDTVAWTAARLQAALGGATLTRAELRWPSLAEADLVGATTVRVVARGKHLLHRLDLHGQGLTLHSHLRMDGTWRVRPAQESVRWDHRLRALLGTADATALGRSLGMLDLVATADEDRLVGHLGPDILARAWPSSDAGVGTGSGAQRAGEPGAGPGSGPGPHPGSGREIAVARLAGDDRSLAEALLDQRVLAGLGTFWVSESCFARRLNPWQTASQVPTDEVAALLDWARPRMLRSARTGAQSVTGLARRDALGAVHALSGRPCRRCGRPVRVALVGAAPRERTIFYCPACQGGLAPTDDGRPQAPLGATRPDRRSGGGGSGRAQVYRGRSGSSGSS